MIIAEPKDFMYYAEGLYYKIGVHGKLFRWAWSEWVRSSRQVHEVETLHKKHQRINAKIVHDAKIAAQDREVKMEMEKAKKLLDAANKRIIAAKNAELASVSWTPEDVLAYTRSHRELKYTVKKFNLTREQVIKICKMQRDVEKQVKILMSK